ncbi:MAG: YceI family protein [Thermoanaerobaculaceae bacterium]
MRASISILLLTLAATVPVSAEELVLRLDPAETTVRFTLQATMHTAEGVVPVASGEIRFDRATGLASGQVVLDARRATTSSKRRDEKMHAEVLESGRYPTIVFVPTRLEAKEDAPDRGTVKLWGTLSIHGTDHPVELVAAVRREGDRVVADARLVVPYVAWGMHDPSVLVLRVAKQVEVRIHAVGTLSPAAPATPPSGGA